MVAHHEMRNQEDIIFRADQKALDKINISRTGEDW